MLAGVFLGNLAGRLLFARIGRFRMIYAISDRPLRSVPLLFFARNSSPPPAGALLELFSPHGSTLRNDPVRYPFLRE